MEYTLIGIFENNNNEVGIFAPSYLFTEKQKSDF